MFAIGCYQKADSLTGFIDIWQIGLHNCRASTPAGDRFNEARIGLDHLSFRAPDEAALHELAEKLIAASVPTKGVEYYAPNIQLEYWRNEPTAS